jgi:hypothetical protein
MLLNPTYPKYAPSYAWDETFDTEEFKDRVSSYNAGLLWSLEEVLGASTIRSI